MLFSIFSLGHVLKHAPFILKLKDLHFIPLSSTNRRCCKNEFCNTFIIRSFFYFNFRPHCLFTPLSSPCVTDVTAKKCNLLGSARAYKSFVLICARESEWNKFSIPLVAPFRAVGCTTSIHTKITSFCNTELSNSTTTEIFLSLFCDFFPLWGNISPYTYRGARWRCAPFSFFFHGESHSHIYADTSDNIPQRQSAQSASFERESCTFTNLPSRCAINPNRSLDRSL